MFYVDVFLLYIQCWLTLKTAGIHLSVQMEPCSAKRDWWVPSPSINFYILHTYNHITFHGNPIQGDFSIYTAPRSLKCKVTKINV